MASENMGLPGQLLEKVKEADWRKTLEFGERNARERGLKSADVETEIAAVRSGRVG